MSQNRLNEAEILDAWERLESPFPFLSYPPYDVCDSEAEEAYYEQQVSPDLWGSLQLLMDMLSRADSIAPQAHDLLKQHIERYLSAIHRLAPDEYIEKIEIYVDDEELRPTLFWSIALNSFPCEFRWLKPWLNRLDKLDDDELICLIETIVENQNTYPQDARALLLHIQSQVSSSRTEVLKKLYLIEFNFGR